MERKIVYSTLGIILGILIIIYSLSLSGFYKNYLIFLAIYIIIFSIVLPVYYSYKKKKEVEYYFPIFIRDVSQECEAGATLPQAIKAISKGDYGLLTDEIKKIVYQISLGITIEKALKNFSEKWDIPSIKRSISSIIEAEKAGGNLPKTLYNVSQAISMVENLKKERKSKIKSFTSTVYILFFILISILVILIKIINSPFLNNIFPNLIIASLDNYSLLFQKLIVIQGIFTGLIIGKVSERDIRAGIIHASILSIVGFILFTILIRII